MLEDGSVVATGYNLYGGCNVQSWTNIKRKGTSTQTPDTPIQPPDNEDKENPNDLSLLTDYANYMSKYAEFVRDFEKWKDEDLNNEELAYYIDVQARVSKKLLKVAQ